MSITTPKSGIGRLTLTLTAKTIRELRLLAALHDKDQHAIVEELFLRAGLTAMVEGALSIESARPVQEPIMSRSPLPFMEPKPVLIESPAPESQPEYLTAPSGATDDDIPW